MAMDDNLLMSFAPHQCFKKLKETTFCSHQIAKYIIIILNLLVLKCIGIVLGVEFCTSLDVYINWI